MKSLSGLAPKIGITKLNLVSATQAHQNLKDVEEEKSN